MNRNNTVEVLSPAGDMEKFIYAIEYGADAVYLAGQMYGMRAASGNFDRDELKTAVEYAHERDGGNAPYSRGFAR